VNEAIICVVPRSTLYRNGGKAKGRLTSLLSRKSFLQMKNGNDKADGKKSISSYVVAD
jgi:hypothetical protein